MSVQTSGTNNIRWSGPSVSGATVTISEYISSDIHTWQTGLKAVLVFGWGGGGAGQNGYVNDSGSGLTALLRGGAGGGGGAFNWAFINVLDLGPTSVVTIGAGSIGPSRNVYSGTPGVSTVCTATAAAGDTTLDSIFIVKGARANTNTSGTQAGPGGDGNAGLPWYNGVAGSPGGQGDENSPAEGSEANQVGISTYPPRRSAGGGGGCGYLNNQTTDLYTGRCGGGVRTTDDYATYAPGGTKLGNNTGGAGADGADGPTDIGTDFLLSILAGMGIAVDYASTYGPGHGGQGGNTLYDGDSGNGGAGGRTSGGGGGAAVRFDANTSARSGAGGDGGDGLMYIVEIT